ncbi:hypothetical protein HD806DRAFT_520718 [Xylariaceae sp. AK1471]|nr:hypothetical protein HD806DRAFT_520718 [Xylariaceae sp. AK1471]
MSLPVDIEAGLPLQHQEPCGSSQPQAEPLQNATENQSHPMHDGLYSQILKGKQGSTTQLDDEFYTSHDVERIAVNGFPSVAAFHAKYPNTRSCRAFRFLNQKLLTLYQCQLTCLLGELVNLDVQGATESETPSGNHSQHVPFDKTKFISRCLRSSDQASLVQVPKDNKEEDEEHEKDRIDAMRENLVANIERISSNYHNRVNWEYELRKFPRPSMKTHENRFRRIQNLGGLNPDALDYLRAIDDFIYADADPLYERFHSFLIWIRRAIVRSIKLLGCNRFIPQEHIPFGSGDYSAWKIRLLVKILMVVVSSTLVLIPVGLLYLVAPVKAISFLIVALFGLVFAFTLIGFDNRMSHVLLGLAAYYAFRRRWAIQQVSSSTRASVQGLHRASTIFGSDPDAFSHVEATGASAIVQATYDIIRTDDQGKVVRHLCDIETLVMRVVHFEATDPRDTIFSLWSLADSRTRALEQLPGLNRRLRFGPSCYYQPYTIPRSNGLHDCRAGLEQLHTRHLECTLGSGRRMNGDSLIGPPGRKVYNASGDLAPNVNIVARAAADAMLLVSGQLVSRESQASPRIVDGVIPNDALRLLGWTDRTTVDNIPDRLWRTLVADRTTEGSRAPSWWRRASMYVLSMASRDRDVNTQKLLADKSLPQAVLEYLRRVQVVVWNRKIFSLGCPTDATGSGLIPSPGLVGLGPRDTQHGDYVCALAGCSVFVVLRDTQGAQHGLYELVGECYVHGLMDGEAFRSLPSTPGKRPSGTLFALI